MPAARSVSGRGLAIGRGRDSDGGHLRDITGGGGLAQMQAPEGTLISFATQPATSCRMAPIEIALTQGAGGNHSQPGLGISTRS